MASSSTMAAAITTVAIRTGFSDGDASYHPPAGSLIAGNVYEQGDDTLFRKKLAELWMKERGDFVQGMKYILDRLPAGYSVFKTERLGDRKKVDGKRVGKFRKRVDSFIFGHPSVDRYRDAKKFDRAPYFFKHFLALMKHCEALADGTTEAFHCECCMVLESAATNGGEAGL